MENNDYAMQETIFKKGLTALILSWLIGLVGLILAIINKKNIKNYLAQGGELQGKGKTGNILTTIAIPLGIVNTIAWVYVIVVYFILGAAMLSAMN